jgi:hypothetical protein
MPCTCSAMEYPNPHRRAKPHLLKDAVNVSALADGLPSGPVITAYNASLVLSPADWSAAPLGRG